MTTQGNFDSGDNESEPLLTPYESDMFPINSAEWIKHQEARAEQVRAEFRELINEDMEAYKQQQERIKQIKAIGKLYLQTQGLTYFGRANFFYIGPDVDNDKLIYVRGNAANAPLEQMSINGRRSRKIRKAKRH